MESSSNFCSQCGASLSPGDAFCSQCGARVGDARASGVGTGTGTATGTEPDAGTGTDTGAKPDAGTTTTGRSAFRRRVESFTVEGWEVEHDYGDRVVMVDRRLGSWVVHALLLFTWGIGNLLYAWYHYSPGADRLELRADGTHRYVSGGGRGSSTNGPRDAGSDSADSTGGSVLLGVFLALAGLGVLNGASSLPTVFVGAILLAGALYAFPPTRERIRERESVDTFGWVRSTDETVVDAPDAPCTACSRPVGTGVERTFHRTLYVAGLPITTDEEGRNRYCRSCAQGDPFTGHGLGDADRETVREV